MTFQHSAATRLRDLCLIALAASGTACSKGNTAELGASSTLDVQVSGTQDIGIDSTEKANDTVRDRGYLAAAPGATLALADGAQEVLSAQLSNITDKTVHIVFGYDRAEAAQLKGKIVLCSSMKGLNGTLPWRKDEKCIVPDGFGATQQLALLSCGSLNGEATSCDSMTELLELMHKTYFNKKPAGATLADTGSYAVDPDFDNIGKMSGASGSVTISSALGNTTIDDAIIISARASVGGLALADGGGTANSETQYIMKKGVGAVGISSYDGVGGGGPIGPSNSGHPAPDGAPVSLSLQGGGTGPAISGNVKIFIVD